MEQLNSSAATFNISSTPGDPSPASWASIKLVSVVVVSICFLLGVPGNIAVIILKPNWQHLSSLSQSLMLNLAISDLICLLPLPLWIYTFVKGWTLGLVALVRHVIKDQHGTDCHFQYSSQSQQVAVMLTETLTRHIELM
ncbi:hypothetical protein KUCAC02_020355 [Chaenocephalus aceratus]|uniref:Uncharacterized protein n=1 Tax=Chaenocephalus aceratus TaxID=36190 RepID=A0ACB9VSM1_CHAAC|nr:hypothetical protein KUCAC02_020355 [Chaenocephalus aceratus]